MKRSIIKNTSGLLSQSAGKQNQIEGLKQQIYQLKDLEYDLFRLNDEITNIEAKYGMVLDEKDRNQVLLKNKLSINKKSIQETQSDIEGIKNRIDQVSLQVSNLTRDNITLQRVCDNKENQIINMNVSIRELEKTNQMKTMQLQQLEEMLTKFKENKVKMEDQCDKLCRKLGENRQNWKQLDKQTKNQIALERSLGTVLQKLRIDGDDLMTQMRARETLLKQTSEQYQKLTDQTSEATQLNQKLDKECKLTQENYDEVAKVLEHTQRVNEDKVKKLKQLELLAARTEEDLNKSIIKKDGFMKLHTDLATQNKDLNLEIDDCLMKILQLENVNKILQKGVQSYIACDEEARIMLDRRQRMTQLLQNVGSKLSKTQSAIAHLF